MTISPIKNIIKKHIFIIFSEKYTNASNQTFIERYVAKHPLLRPELIVVNDQIHGFKKLSKKVGSLEEFPIYLEIEGIFKESESFIEEEDDVDENGDNELECFIDSIELYSENQLNCQDRLTDVIYLANQFEEFVRLERVINVNDPKIENIIVTSKIQEFLVQLSDIDDENETNEIFIEMKTFNLLLEQHLIYFTAFIRILDDILVKKKPISHITKEVEALLKK